MSLKVYLRFADPVPVTPGSGIFVRDGGSTREISREEWDAKFPGTEPCLVRVRQPESTCAYDANITHNLGGMAEAAGIYKHLWRPEEIGVTHAKQLVEPLTAGIAMMKANPAIFKGFDSPNGWGTYEQFVPWLERYLAACEQYPDAAVEVSR